MRLLSLGVLLLPLLFFFGCSQKEPPQQESPKIILIKTKKTAFHDMGFVRKFDDRVEVQFYASAQALFSMKIYEDVVCINASCMKKAAFYQDYIGAKYPIDTIDRIFLGREIFGGEGMKVEGGETIQRVAKLPFYDIVYKISPKRALFKDSKNGVMIMVKDLQ